MSFQSSSRKKICSLPLTAFKSLKLPHTTITYTPSDLFSPNKLSTKWKQTVIQDIQGSLYLKFS